MSASGDGASGGALRGHSVAFALVAIVAGMALVVTYAASDGAIFGLNVNPVPSSDNGQPANDDGGATVISRDVFDDGENAPSQPDEENSSSITPPKSGSTLSEEERKLLAMSNYPWDSMAGRYVASNQDSIDRFSRPAQVQNGTEPLVLTDKVTVDVVRDRDVLSDEVQDDDLEQADDIIGNIEDIPVNLTKDGEQADDEGASEEERPPPQDTEQEEPQDGGSGDRNQTGGEEPGDDDSSGDDSGGSSGSGDGDGDSSSGDGGRGNSTDMGNSTDTQGPSEDPGSGSSSNSTIIITPILDATISIG